MTNFKIIREFIDASNASNSSLQKQAVLKEYTEHEVVRKALYYTYNTFLQFGVTSSNCIKNSTLVSSYNTFEDFFLLLDNLSDRTLTGHDAIKAVNRYVQDNPLYEDIIWNIIDRNLKTRSTATLINKVYPGLIPTFDVALAKAFDEKTQKKVNWSDGWSISRKLDGVRCLTIIDEEGKIKFFSRQGKEFLTLDYVRKDLEKLNLKSVVLDGEICMVDENGDEDFTRIIKEIKRKNHTILTPFYYVFDLLTLEDFSNKTSVDTFKQRINTLQETIATTKYVSVLPQYDGSDEVFSSMMTESKEGGWEGLMLRKDTPYKGKRSDEILKVKQMYDEEYEVIDLDFDTHRVIVSGKEVEEEMLKNVYIKHKGTLVSVGSGFSQEQRRYYYINPNELLGSQITVQYFEETTNKNGTHSLRFPVVKAVYDGKREF